MLDKPTLIRQARIQSNLSQQNLAESIGVSRLTVSFWERGARNIPRNRWDQLVMVLGIPFRDIPDEPMCFAPRQVPVHSQPRSAGYEEPRQRAVTGTWAQQPQDAMRIDILENFVGAANTELHNPKVTSPEDVPQGLDTVTGLLVESRCEEGLDMTLAEARDYAETMLGQLSTRGWVKQAGPGWVLTRAGYDQFLRAWPTATRSYHRVHTYYYPDLV